MSKLSASSLNTFLKSPRSYYYRYVAKLEPCQLTTNTYDEAKLSGVIHAQMVDRFYHEVSESENTEKTITDWLDQTSGWVPDQKRDKLTKALQSWTTQYYQLFRPSDGIRTSEGSEKWIENDRFCGRLDGISADGIIHECKSTSRAPQISEQLWKIGNSIQIKLYCVMTDAQGYILEMAYKDPPYQLFRAPIVIVSDKQKQAWEQELNALADKIYSLGVDINNYVCSGECCLVTKGVVSMCGYQLLCSNGLNDETTIFYKAKEHRK